MIFLFISGGTSHVSDKKTHTGTFVISVSLEGTLPQETITVTRKVPSLLLILSKTYFDFHSHRKEHGLDTVQE